MPYFSQIWEKSKRGQFVLAVDDCRHDPDDLFASAQAAERAGDIVEAKRFYRMLMKGNDSPRNMLRSHGRNVEVEAALRTAARIDPDFAETWYNLADLLDNQGRSEAAIECLRKVVRVAPDYSDAMFNLALLLQRKKSMRRGGRLLATLSRPRRSSEWATRARRSLKVCEMQQHLTA